MANYGSVSRYRLRTIKGWLSSLGSEVATWFDVDRRPLIGPSTIGRSVRIGPIEVHPSERRPWMRRMMEQRAVNAIERACVDSMLSSCGDPIEVADLSELISEETFRMSGAPSRGSTIFVSPAFSLDRPVFMSHWELVVSWSVPKNDAVRMHWNSGSIVPIGWPRLDRIGEILLDGGSIEVHILVDAGESIVRYRFADRGDMGVVVCPSRLIA